MKNFFPSLPTLHPPYLPPPATPTLTAPKRSLRRHGGVARGGGGVHERDDARGRQPQPHARRRTAASTAAPPRHPPAGDHTPTPTATIIRRRWQGRVVTVRLVPAPDSQPKQTLPPPHEKGGRAPFPLDVGVQGGRHGGVGRAARHAGQQAGVDGGSGEEGGGG